MTADTVAHSTDEASAARRTSASLTRAIVVTAVLGGLAAIPLFFALSPYNCGGGDIESQCMAPLALVVYLPVSVVVALLALRIFGLRPILLTFAALALCGISVGLLTLRVMQVAGVHDVREMPLIGVWIIAGAVGGALAAWLVHARDTKRWLRMLVALLVFALPWLLNAGGFAERQSAAAKLDDRDGALYLPNITSLTPSFWGVDPEYPLLAYSGEAPAGELMFSVVPVGESGLCALIRAADEESCTASAGAAVAHTDDFTWVVESRGGDALVAEFGKGEFDLEAIRAALISAPQVDARVILGLPSAT